MISKQSTLSADQIQTVQEEASKILSELAFKNSDRCTKLLRFLVEESLKDDGFLKERRIGHEVFGRDAGYDTAADPIVRNVASEVRKRLRQFYSEHTNGRAVRIELPLGAYGLQFHFAESQMVQRERIWEVEAPLLLHQAPDTQVQPSSGIRRTKSYLTPILIAAGVLVIVAVQVWLSKTSHDQVSGIAAYSFWEPVFASKKEIFISVGHSRNDEPRPKDAAGLRQIAMTDLNAYTNIASFLKMRARPFQMQLDNVTTMEDLRGRPAVLIGNINNEWVLRLTKNLRYRYVWDHEKRTVGIQDGEHPGVNLWELDFKSETAIHTVDYAIAERFIDATTGDVVVCVAGAGTVGTQAASDLITQPQFLEKLPSELRDPQKNIQIVLKTSIVDGVAGPPEIIRTYMW